MSMSGEIKDVLGISRVPRCPRSAAINNLRVNIDILLLRLDDIPYSIFYPSPDDMKISKILG
jgi:hypothetical protein